MNNRVPRPAEAKTILVAGIDSLRRKNLYQYRGLGKYGHRFVVVTFDALRDSETVCAAADNVELLCVPERLPRSFFILLMLRLLITRQFDAAEVYADSWLQLLITALIKLRGIRVIVIARGSADYAYANRSMPEPQRLAFGATYRLADLIIYKEPAMEPIFTSMGKRRMLLPNAVSSVRFVPRAGGERCCFLYLNRILKLRNPELALTAFLQVCDELGLNRHSSVRLRIVGLQGGRAGSDLEQETRLRKLIEGRDSPIELHPWSSDPDAWLSEADVFILPAETVFLNFGLLEAMAWGIPAIVQATPHSHLIVTHGVNGFVLPPVVPVWAEHMRMLMEDPSLRHRLGDAARTTVDRYYSHTSYCRTYHRVYCQLSSRGTTRTRGEHGCG